MFKKQEVAPITTVDKIAEKVKQRKANEVEYTKQDFEDIEEIIDEALEDVEVQEKFLNEMEDIEMQVTNNQLYKSLLEINETLITSKREELIVDNKIFRAIEKNMDITKEVNNKFNKTTAGLIVAFSILFLLIGMQDEKWLPYVGNILDFARTATNVVK